MKKAQGRSFRFCYFPFQVRYTQTKLLTSRISLDELDYLQNRPKEEQLLLFYNIPTIVVKRGRVEKVQSNTRQTVCIIDFDKCSERDTIEHCFNGFCQELNSSKPMLVQSYSGYHMVYVVDSTLPPDYYRDLQLGVISKHFSELLDYVDFTSSVSMSRGFYHSKHLNTWIKEGRVNATPSRQGPAHKFFSESMEFKREDLKGYPSESNLNNLRNYLMKILEEHRGDPYYAKRYRWVERYCATRLRRILVTSIGNSNEGILQGSNVGETEEKSQTSHTNIESHASLPAFSAAAIQRLPGEVGERSFRETAVVGERHAERSREAVESSGLQRNPEKGCRCCDFYHSGAEGDKGTGFCGFFSSERILAFVQDVRVLCYRRKVDLNLLGDILSTNSLRSYGYWSIKSEESDFSIFFGIVRQVLEETYGRGVFVGNSSKCVAEWLRFADVYLANKPTSSRVLQRIANVSARGIRLYLKTQGIRIEQCSSDFISCLDPNIIPEEAAVDFLEHLFPGGSCFSTTNDLSKDDRQTLNRLFREEKCRLVLGIQRLMAHFLRLFPYIGLGQPIDVGAEEFRQFFGIHIRGATALRRLIMPTVSVVNAEYIPTVKRRSYRIDPEVIISYGFMDVDRILPSETEMAESLGDGNTWEMIKRYTRTSLIKFRSRPLAEDFWSRCIDKSTANEKNKRKREISEFLEKIDSQLGVTNGVITKLESRSTGAQVQG